jgi:type IV secretory pathway protease TraF
VQAPYNLIVTNPVVAMPPEPFASFLAESGYLSRGVPLIKRSTSSNLSCNVLNSSSSIKKY